MPGVGNERGRDGGEGLDDDSNGQRLADDAGGGNEDLVRLCADERCRPPGHRFDGVPSRLSGKDIGVA